MGLTTVQHDCAACDKNTLTFILLKEWMDILSWSTVALTKHLRH